MSERYESNTVRKDYTLPQNVPASCQLVKSESKGGRRNSNCKDACRKESGGSGALVYTDDKLQVSSLDWS